MAKLIKMAFNLPITMSFACLLLCIGMCLNGCSTSQVVKPQVVSEKKSTNKKTYQEIKKDGRIYVFTSPAHKAGFEQSGEMGKSIIKIGHGSNGETVVFDSDEAVFEYESHQIKQTLGNLNIGAYRELEKDGRVYVFTSPERMSDFEKSGEVGKGAIVKIGYSLDRKTVVFDSPDAVSEYEKRNNIK